MSGPVLNTLARGYTALTILEHIADRYPQYKKRIKNAQQAGYDSSQILKSIVGDEEASDEKYMTRREQAQKYEKENKKKATLGLISTLGTAGAIAATGYALLQSGKAIKPSQILPPIKPTQQQKGLPYQGQQGLPSPSQVPPTPQPQSPLPRQRTVVPPAKSPIGNAPNPQQPSGSPIVPAYKHDPEYNRNVVQNIKADQKVSTAVASGLQTPAIAQLLRESLPKGQLAIIDKLPGGLEQVIEDYRGITTTETSKKGKMNALQKFRERQKEKKGLIEEEKERFNAYYGKQNQQEQQQDQEQLPLEEPNQQMAQQSLRDNGQISQEMKETKTPVLNDLENKSLKDQIIQKEIANIEQTQDKIGQLENQVQEMPDEKAQNELEFWNNRLNEQMQRLQEIEEMGQTDFEENELPKLEESKLEEKPKSSEPKVTVNLAILPKGQVGEVESIKNGVAKVNVDGKVTSHKASDLQKEPEGIEDQVRKIIDSIPESEKSTSLQSVVLIPLGNENVMMTQFYDGKWAWYKGVSKEDYDTISLGNYTPKGTAKTGIAEYKAGVMDSRGSGFHNLVKIDPRFTKEFKNINWGYADNEYSLLKNIQPILHKISKERKDEEGNVITPKKRQPKD